MTNKKRVKGNGVLLKSSWIWAPFKQDDKEGTYTPVVDLVERTCRLREICFPPSSPSAMSPSEASNASRRSSSMLAGFLATFDVFETIGSMFHKRTFAS